MPREPLPVECFLVILRFLSEEDDWDTMARLLRVNKTFCAATLPSLYGECFNNDIHTYRSRSDKDPNMTTYQFARTLLRQLQPQSQIPDILRVVYLSQDSQHGLQPMKEQPPPPTPVFKYSHFVRRIVPYYKFRSMFEFFCNNSPVMDYAVTHKLFDKYVAEGHLSNDIHDDSRNKALEDALLMDIDRELIWTICQDHLETIEEISIPLTDIGRYMNHIHQLTSLSKVSFSITNTVLPWEYKYTNEGQQTGDRRREEPEDVRDRFFKGIVQFVQQHTSIHKNVLRNVELPSFGEPDPDVHFGIQALLPPLQTPRSINNSNLYELAVRLEDTNLSYVKSINLQKYDVKYVHAEKAFELLSESHHFLPRCRSLKHLVMTTLGSDMFHWAVLEKKKMDDERRRMSSVGQHFGPQQHGYKNHNHVPLVPLRSVDIGSLERVPLGQEVNDIAFAFSDSLEEFFASSWSFAQIHRMADLANTPQVVYGRDWDLPRLRTLVFRTNHSQLHFDMHGLQRCRTLESLVLEDDIIAFNLRDIRSWSPVSLPNLKKLDLKGSPALRFNMDSLHHSPCLEHFTWGTVAYEHQDGNICCIPSPEELESIDPDTYGTEDLDLSGTPVSNQNFQLTGRRPRYTWNWYLPMLSSLHITTMFAFIFDFQWLQHLPNLHRLHLDSGAPMDQRVRERRITLKDLLEDQQQPRDKDITEETPSSLYFSLPKLESMVLDGRWILEERVLEVLCLFVAPNLHWVNLGKACVGHTLQEWIPLARKMPRMENVYLYLPLTCDEVQKMGLIRDNELQGEQRNKTRTHYYLLATPGHFHDVLES
ncbi:hypothetical protein BGX34_001417 [Mortierella sp. NVP85]|nr:hypothetical protein BGX34_001417 [Mortierella sp. NVP85]